MPMNPSKHPWDRHAARSVFRATLSFLFAIAVFTGCGDDDSGSAASRLAISSPANGSAAPVDGRISVEIDFGAPLTARAVVEVLLSDADHPAPNGIDITSLFLPIGAAEFTGLQLVSADLAPLSAGSLLLPGASGVSVRVDRDGGGALESARSTFECRSDRSRASPDTSCSPGARRAARRIRTNVPTI